MDGAPVTWAVGSCPALAVVEEGTNICKERRSIPYPHQKNTKRVGGGGYMIGPYYLQVQHQQI